MDRLLGRGTYFFPNYIRWPLHRSPSVTAVHDLSFEKVPETVDGPNAVLLRREVRNSVEHSDAITALTETMADEIAEHYDLPRAGSTSSGRPPTSGTSTAGPIARSPRSRRPTASTATTW